MGMLAITRLLALMVVGSVASAVPLKPGGRPSDPVLDNAMASFMNSGTAIQALKRAGCNTPEAQAKAASLRKKKQRLLARMSAQEAADAKATAIAAVQAGIQTGSKRRSARAAKQKAAASKLPHPPPKKRRQRQSRQHKIDERKHKLDQDVHFAAAFSAARHAWATACKEDEKLPRGTGNKKLKIQSKRTCGAVVASVALDWGVKIDKHLVLKYARKGIPLDSDPLKRGPSDTKYPPELIRAMVAHHQLQQAGSGDTTAAATAILGGCVLIFLTPARTQLAQTELTRNNFTAGFALTTRTNSAKPRFGGPSMPRVLIGPRTIYTRTGSTCSNLKPYGLGMPSVSPCTMR